MEDYIKGVFAICRSQDDGLDSRASTNAIAARMGVTAASANSAVQKLAELGLLNYEKYQGASLSEAGMKMAIEVVRHHRLIEAYLYEAMGVPWDQVHIEAEKWEHVLSEEMEARMDEILGYPTRDPHGSPIPGPDLVMPTIVGEPLTDCDTGKTYRIERVRDGDAGLLRYLGERGLFPDTQLTLADIEPYGGALNISVNNKSINLGAQAAACIYVCEVQA